MSKTYYPILKYNQYIEIAKTSWTFFYYKYSAKDMIHLNKLVAQNKLRKSVFLLS